MNLFYKTNWYIVYHLQVIVFSQVTRLAEWSQVTHFRGSKRVALLAKWRCGKVMSLSDASVARWRVFDAWKFQNVSNKNNAKNIS